MGNLKSKINRVSSSSDYSPDENTANCNGLRKVTLNLKMPYSVHSPVVETAIRSVWRSLEYKGRRENFASIMEEDEGRDSRCCQIFIGVSSSVWAGLVDDVVIKLIWA
ncbi:unnamed protein product [Citrullus colocynthis]|uniref:Uncharacterized protein n=1 Tax=Citrullus colocynthis TaxID=252529 RepID=A0ABP0YGK9_9ROSI